MEMNVDLNHINRTRDVFVAIGEVLRQDDGPSSIVSVNVFQKDGPIGAVIGWDIHPTPEQIELFRTVWDDWSHLPNVVIVHDAPSSIVSKPVSTPKTWR
jgi:hypothetical protein